MGLYLGRTGEAQDRQAAAARCQWPFGNRAGYQMLAPLAVDGAGNIYAAILMNSGITVISPDGKNLEHIAMPDYAATNT